MAEEWKESSIERNDIVDLLNNTKKLADMYSEVMKTKREERRMKRKIKMKNEKRRMNRGLVKLGNKNDLCSTPICTV